MDKKQLGAKVPIELYVRLCNLLNYAKEKTKNNILTVDANMHQLLLHALEIGVSELEKRIRK